MAGSVGKVYKNKSQLARDLGVSRTSLYYQPRQPLKDESLYKEIVAVIDKNPTYGYRRVALALKINKKRAQRVMRKYKLRPYKRKARWKKRRDLRTKPTEYGNLIKSNLPNTPNHTYVSDFTYIRYHSKFIYLATYMDVFSREIVGWDVSTKHTKDLVIGALVDGLVNTDFKLPQIVHSDQGSEYKSKECTGFVKQLGIQISMSSKGSPWENGYQESFYNNFKTELGLEFERSEDMGELVEGIHQTINYYNNERIHTALKMAPVRFRKLHEIRS
ncbi:IS3 family transposase [Candidatus Dojkabacteria bacterium]|nr:IS3 family transposase [Candidatus Dojkabacteria bacterium]